jgi:hypothetical protein
MKHLAVVVILDLHHFVAETEGQAETLDFLRPVRVDGLLEITIERASTEASPLHRT